MRRVYDDTKYYQACHDLMRAVQIINRNPSIISEYSYGMYRARASRILKEALRIANTDGTMYQFGKVEHANGIGNNNAYEIIYLGGPNEQQICALFHANEDLYSGCYVYVTDIDGNRKSTSMLIKGCEK